MVNGKWLILAALALAAASGRSACAEIDTKTEVAAAVYSVSVSMAAAERVSDEKLRADQRRIDTLSAAVASGKASAAELAKARDAVVAEMAAKDQAFAAQIAAFRGGLTDILRRPGGVQALAAFNAGDKTAALSALDALATIDEAARKQAADIQDAAEWRTLAQLAVQSLGEGQATLGSVVSRYERITSLDPGFAWDWIELDRLYRAAGRTGDAQRAAERALGVALDDNERSSADSEIGKIRLSEGDAAGALKAAEASLAITRQVAGAHPDDADDQHNLIVDLNDVGDMQAAGGDLPTALASHDEALALARRSSAADPGDAGLRIAVAVCLSRIAAAHEAQGRGADALAADRESLTILRGLAEADPGSVEVAGNLAIALTDIGRLEQGQDVAGAVRDYGEAIYVRRRLVAATPEDLSLQSALGVGLGLLSDVESAAGRTASAKQDMDESAAIAARLASADPVNADTQRNYAKALTRQAMRGGDASAWAKLVAHLQSMDARGMLTSEDRQVLAIARARASGQADPAL